MSQPLNPQTIGNIGTYGLVRTNSVDDNLIPDGAVTEVYNFHFDRLGAATVRPGMTALGATGVVSTSNFYTLPCVGLHNAQGGTLLAAFSNGNTSAIYAFDGSNWGSSRSGDGSPGATLDGGTASVSIRFVDFGSYTVAINFISNTESSMRMWNAGSSRHWEFTGNPLNLQNMWGYNCQLGEVYKNRMYLSGDTSTAGNPSRLFFSSVISSTGIITWNPTTDYVDINPGDGEGITALKRYSLELEVFKPNYIYRFKTSGVDPDAIIKVGTRSQESVVEGKKGLYFHHDTGFWRYDGGYPVEIGRPISDIFSAIPFSQYASIIGWKDNDHIYWSLGNLTITENYLSQTYRNVVARFTESSEIWTMYSYARDIRRAIVYTRGSYQTIVVGLDFGIVASLDTGSVTDLGEPIPYRMRTKWYDWEGIWNRKIIQDIVTVCEKAQAIEILYQTDENYEYQTIGEVKSLVNFFTDKQIRFHRIRFLVTGISRFNQPIFKTINILRGENEGIVLEPFSK